MTNANTALERAYLLALQRPEGAPEFYLRLRQSKLAFLMAYHPELAAAGLLELKGGDRITFRCWGDDDHEDFIPIFTSIERAQSALNQIDGADHEGYCLSEMQGRCLFGALASTGLEVAVNPNSDGPDLFLPVDLVKGIADGSILKPVPPRRGYGTIRAVPPADYPADFLQPLFHFLRGRPEVRAAWICRQVDAPNAAGVAHAFAIWVAGGPAAAQALEYDFALVAQMACPPGDEFGVMMLDPENPATARFMAKNEPFYSAPDFQVSAIAR